MARELPSTLTAEVVTGQVDVSGWSGEEETAYFIEGNGQSEEESMDSEEENTHIEEGIG